MAVTQVAVETSFCNGHVHVSGGVAVVAAVVDGDDVGYRFSVLGFP